MSLYALCSPGGSPGVTTTALALALTWSPPVLLAECDPAGGAILAGLFAGHLPAPRGLLGAAFDAGTGTTVLSAGSGGHLGALDTAGERMFLAGLSDPRQAPGLAPAWPAVARALTAQRADVLADCGRLDAADTQPIAVLSGADLAVLVLRPTLRQIAAAGPRIEMLTQVRGGAERIRLLLVGDEGHRPGEVAKTLGVAVLGTIPFDQRTAAVLSDGDGRRGNLTDRRLMRGAKTVVKVIKAATPPPRLTGMPPAMPPLETPLPAGLASLDGLKATSGPPGGGPPGGRGLAEAGGHPIAPTAPGGPGGSAHPGANGHGDPGRNGGANGHRP